MNEKKANSVLKLVSNKIFITLMIFAIGIIMISSVFTRNAQKVAENTQSQETNEVSVASQSKEEKIEEFEFDDKVQDIVPVAEDPEVKEVMVRFEYKMPLAGKIQKAFSTDELLWDETMQDWRTHCGIDIEADAGTEVDTAAQGVVVDVSESEKYGVTVKVQHHDGVITVYKNLEKSVVKKDDILDEGQMIGTVGNKGEFEVSQKPHLHFEVVADEKYINPLDFIK